MSCALQRSGETEAPDARRKHRAWRLRFEEGRLVRGALIDWRPIMPDQLRLRGPGFLAAFLGALLIVVLVPTKATSQSERADPPAIEDQLADWQRNAERAAQVLDEGAASADALEDLRASLAEDRDAAFSVVRTGSVAVDALGAQLDALGPAPEAGLAEAEDIAARRAEISQALSVARRPLLLAQEAYERADVLIGELDRRIRSAGARRVMQVSPTPLNPTNWVAVFGEASNYAAKVIRDIRGVADRPSQIELLKSRLPILGLMGALGLALVFIAQPLASLRLARAYGRAVTRRGRYLLAVAENLSHLVIPFIGGLALAVLPTLAGVVPSSVNNLSQALPDMIFVGVLAHWLGYAMFAPGVPALRLLRLNDGKALRGSVLCQLLGFTLAAEIALEAIERDHTFSPAADAFLGAPVILCGGVLLLLLSQVLLTAARESRSADDAAADQSREGEGYLLILSRLIQIAAVVAIVVSQAGFIELSRAALIPTIETLGFAGFAYLIYRTIMALVSSFAGDGDADVIQNSLLPIGVAFILLLAMSPLLALSWGARPSDIAEIWRLMSDGVALGDLRISLDVVIILILVFSLGVVATHWLQRLLKTTILPRTRMDFGAQTAIATFAGYAGYTLAAVVALTSAGLNLSSFAVVAGALSVGIGFGLQTIVSNFVSGLILLIERPIKEGDWIAVSGQEGIVRKISVRSTRIETFDRHDVVVPNADLIAGVVKNVTLTNRNGRLIIPIGVAYGSDPERVIELLLEAATDDSRIMRHPEPMAIFVGLGASSLDFELRCYLNDAADMLGLRSHVLVRIYKSLGDAGIEIPFPQQDVHLRDLEVLVEALIGRQTETTNSSLKLDAEQEG